MRYNDAELQINHRVPDKLLVLDGSVHLVHGCFEQSEVGFIPVDLGEISSVLVDNSNFPPQSFLRRIKLRLFFTSPLTWGSGW